MSTDSTQTMPPLFSIITAVYNGADHLVDCIESVRSQTCLSREHIIIDGGSTDGTVDIIKKCAKELSHWVSERDQGVSDAFNKGVRASRGRLILFLGSDDYLIDPQILDRVASQLSVFTQPYFFYGDAEYVYKGRTRCIHKNFSQEKFRRFNCVPHQAMFLDRHFFDTYGFFDVNLRIAMDYEHIARFVRERSPEYIDRVIAGMRRYGRSSHAWDAHREMDAVRLQHGLATRSEIAVGRVLLAGKIAMGKLFRVDW